MAEREQPADLADEVSRGESDRTPALALSGVTIAVTALVVAVVCAALLAYYLTR